MNLEKLVKFEERKDLEDWQKLNQLLKSGEYFSEYEKKEKPGVLSFGRFLRQYGVKKIIDSHTHSFKYEHFKEPRPVESTICPALPVTSIPNSPLELILWVCNEVYQNGAGVPFRVVTFPLPICHMDAHMQNGYILARSRKYAHRVQAFALTPPSFSRNELEGLAKAGFRGFKPYYFLKEFDIKKQSDFGEAYAHLKISDWLTEDTLDVAEEYGLPVMLHIAPSTEAAYSDAEKMVKKHQNVKFILAHFGLCHEVRQFEKLVGGYAGRDNVLIESSNLQNPEVFELAFKNFDKSQILYGSDLPFSLIRHGVVVITRELVGRLESEDLRARFSKAVGMPFPSTKGDYVYIRQPNIRAFQSIIPKDVSSAHRMALVEQLAAIQAACDKLIYSKEFTQKEMSELLQAFFCGNAKRLLNI